MDGPGMSLFNGAGSIHLNTSAQRIEEEEAIEDQKRRNKELQNDLNNCFDDFIDDDDESVNDSSHFMSMNLHQSRASRHSAVQQKGYENIPMSLQAELTLSDSKKANGIHPVSLSGQRTQAEIHHHNGYGDQNRPEDATPVFPSSQTTQDHYKAGALTNHHQHCYQSPLTGYEHLRHSPSQNPTEFNATSSRQNDDQLQAFYQMRVNEVQRLSEELATCRRDATAAHDALYARLAVAEAERERAQLSLQQSQELVANSKHRITELEHQVSGLNGKLGALGARNEELSAEVTATTAALTDSQRRLQAARITRDTSQATDALFKAQQERYKEDTDQLEKDLMKFRNKLQEKENEILSLETRYRDMERSKEELLIEKGSTINRLAMELEEAQNRLAANETADLKKKISQLVVERDTARLQFKDMAGKLEATATELVDYRTKYIRLQEEQSEMEAVLEQLSEEKESESFTQLKSSHTGRGFSSQADKVALLRNELSKNIAAQKLKKEQIDKLNKSLRQKDQLIESLKDVEARFKRDMELLKEEDQKKTSELRSVRQQLESQRASYHPEQLDELKARCSQLETELNKAMSELSTLLSKHSSLEAKYEEVSSDVERRHSLDRRAHTEATKERDKLMHALKDARNQADEFKTLYVEVCGVKDKLSKELSDLKSIDVYQDLKREQALTEDTRELLGKEKKRVEELAQLLLDQQVKQFDDHLKSYKQSMENSEITTKEKSIIAERHLEITNQFKEENQKLKLLCDEQKEKLSKLYAELEENRILAKKLNTEAELQAERDRLIADLKEKGKQFEVYIQAQQARLLNRRDACTSPVFDKDRDDPISGRRPISRETNRSSVTQQVNIKMEEIIREEIAQHFAVEIKKTEAQFRERLANLEEQYSSNISQLGDVLRLKTQEVASLQGVVLSERAKLKEMLSKLLEYEKKSIASEKLKDEYKRNLERYQLQISSLNTDMESIKNQKHAILEAAEIKNKFYENLKESDRLKEKYRILKKTTIKYKEYITEKDKHVENEIKRIKSNYENSLRKMQQRLENCLKESDGKPNTKLLELQSNYSENMLHTQNGKRQHIS